MATHVRLRNSHAKNTLRTSCDYHFLWKESAKEERMSERSVATSWNTKRKRRAAAARMREMKKAKLSSSTSEHGSEPTPGPSSSDPTSSGSSATPLTEPTPSSSDPTSSATVPSDDEGSVHSESENERDGLESSDEDVPDFDSENAQDVFDDWVVSLPLQDRKMLAVMLMETLQKRTALKSTAAALEAAWITGFNEKTIRGYRKEFFENGGRFKDEARGKYQRACLFNEESLRLQAAMWVRENAVRKGAPNLVAREFCQWVNNELLPSSDLPPNLPRSIGVRTATRWLRRLGFRPTSHKKGAYVDGHERDDVVAHRKEFLEDMKTLRETHLPPPPPSDERAATPPPNAEFLKQLIVIYHDESIFNTNEGQKWAWATGDQPIIQPKTKGAGIMVSDFIEQRGGFLRLTETEAVRAGASFPKTARVLLEYGAEKEGYWNSDRFMANIKNAVAIAEFKYPPEKNTLVFIFDQSSCHKAYAENALNVSRMNVRPGGKQPCMRDTVWAGRAQKLVDDKGVPKGMKQILEERGINTERMKAEDMRTVLSFHDDFQSEKTLVDKYISDKGHRCVFLPKFHCELNPIERVWGQAKVHSRAHTNFTLPGLRSIINPALDSVSTDLMRKYFRRVLEYERAYLEGKKAGKELEAAVKVYKSHRRVFFES